MFFKDFDLDKLKDVKREYKNRDITIIDNDGNEFVIENKIKSYPRKEQLEKYSCYKGVITGIKETPFKVEKWVFVSYKDISNYLRNIKIKNNLLLKSIVTEYCDVIDCINDIINLSLEQSEGRLSYWSDNISNKLEAVKLLDVYRKNKADNFLMYFEKYQRKYEETIFLVNKDLIDKKIVYYSDKSFYHCKATLSFGFKLIDKNSNNELETIGVQIEDNQFRIYKWNKNLTGEECFERYSKLGWFESNYNKKTNNRIRNYLSKMTNKYCSYGKNWVYQYFDTWNENNQDLQDYDKIAELISSELDLALNILKRN